MGPMAMVRSPYLAVVLHTLEVAPRRAAEAAEAAARRRRVAKAAASGAEASKAAAVAGTTRPNATQR